jgi:hypothetical protein
MKPFNQKTNLAHEDASQPYAPPRSGRWVEMALRYRYAIVVLLVFAWVFGQKAWAREFTKASDCVVDQRIGLNMDGGNFFNTSCSMKK